MVIYLEGLTSGSFELIVLSTGREALHHHHRDKATLFNLRASLRPWP